MSAQNRVPEKNDCKVVLGAAVYSHVGPFKRDRTSGICDHLV